MCVFVFLCFCARMQCVRCPADSCDGPKAVRAYGGSGDTRVCVGRGRCNVLGGGFRGACKARVSSLAGSRRLEPIAAVYASKHQLDCRAVNSFWSCCVCQQACMLLLQRHAMRSDQSLQRVGGRRAAWSLILTTTLGSTTHVLVPCGCGCGGCCGVALLCLLCAGLGGREEVCQRISECDAGQSCQLLFSCSATLSPDTRHNDCLSLLPACVQ